MISYSSCILVLAYFTWHNIFSSSVHLPQIAEFPSFSRLNNTALCVCEVCVVRVCSVCSAVNLRVQVSFCNPVSIPFNLPRVITCSTRGVKWPGYHYCDSHRLTLVTIPGLTYVYHLTQPSVTTIFCNKCLLLDRFWTLVFSIQTD